MNPDGKLIKVGFPFYPADLKALDAHLEFLEKAGVPVRQGTVVRALVCLPSATQLFAHSLLMHEAQKARGGVLEFEYVEDTIVVRLPGDQVEKLDSVLTDLAAKGVSTTRAFVLRAAFRALPSGAGLIAFMKEFNEKFPNRPRGAPAAKMKKAKKHG
jgi:hypothetical protein